MRIATLRAAAAAGAFFLAPAALAQVAQPLPLLQDWTNTAQISVDDVWTGVPGIAGYRGDDLAVVSATTDIQAVLVDGGATPLDVNANRTDPSLFNSGGLSEFEIANPVVAMQGSGTADFPHLVFRVITTSFQNIRVRYTLRDIDAGLNGDGSPVDAIQRFALHYRVGTTGDYTNVPAGYVADATAIGETTTTAIDATLPAAANGRASVDIRVITFNALGSDEFVGVDNIQITGEPGTAGEGAPESGLTLAVANPLRGATQVRFTADAPARLALVDVLGRTVAVLADGAMGAQTAALSTAGLAPGVYVLRLDAGGRVLTQTVTVVR